MMPGAGLHEKREQFPALTALILDYNKNRARPQRKARSAKAVRRPQDLRLRGAEFRAASTNRISGSKSTALGTDWRASHRGVRRPRLARFNGGCATELQLASLCITRAGRVVAAFIRHPVAPTVASRTGTRLLRPCLRRASSGSACSYAQCLGCTGRAVPDDPPCFSCTQACTASPV